jgi:hypothetical protein
VLEAFTHQHELVALSVEHSRNPTAAATFDKLPAEVLCTIGEQLSVPSILNLLRTSKYVREQMRPRINGLIGASIRKHAPHLLPYRVEGPYGPAEVEWWDAKVQEAQGQDTPFPWLSYARACHNSPSMRNRERIWGICKQLERVAREKDLLL